MEGNHIKEHLLKQYALLPESIDGLTSLIEESEDYTCLTLKMLMGKRDRGSKSGIVFATATINSARGSEGATCSDRGDV